MFSEKTKSRQETSAKKQRVIQKQTFGKAARFQDTFNTKTGLSGIAIKDRDPFRFEDPLSGKIVDIRQLKYLGQVLNYIDQFESKKLSLSKKQQQQLLIRKQEFATGNSIEGQITASNNELMQGANEAGGISYLHNVSEEVLGDLIKAGSDPNLGFADPDFFERTDRFTWKLLPRVNAAEGIRAFLNPRYSSSSNPAVTIAECQTTMQAVFYHTILNVIGDSRFNRLFGSKEQKVPDDNRLLIEFQLSAKNPLKSMLADERAEMDEEEFNNLAIDEVGGQEFLVNVPGFRPAKLGGWYFIKNYALYNVRHSKGIWGGENALLTGHNQHGEQVFSGFGLSNRTEIEMAISLADEFNGAPSAEEVEHIIKYYPSQLSLILPIPGNLQSLRVLPALTPVAISALETIVERQLPDDHSSHIDELARLLQNTDLQPPVQPRDLLAEMALLYEQGDTPQTQHGDWSDEGYEKVLTWTNATVKKISIRTLMDYYAASFNMNVSHLLRDIIRDRNNIKKSENSLFDVKPGRKFYFPEPAALTKLKKTPGGFQSLGGKLVSAEKLQKEVQK